MFAVSLLDPSFAALLLCYPGQQGKVCVETGEPGCEKVWEDDKQMAHLTW